MPLESDAPAPETPLPLGGSLLPGAGGMNVQELADFLAAFNASTARLKESHDRLRGRVEALAGELSQKNRELSARVEEVSALKNYLANILESISDGVLTVDLDRRLVALNEAAMRLLPPPARAEGEAYGAGIPVEAALSGRSSEVARVLVRALEEERFLQNIEVFLDAEDGSRRILDVAAGPIRNESGAILGAVATFRDNTELVRLEESLRRRERLAALGEMAAQLAHEIRNPLGGIELYTSLLERSLGPGSGESALVSKITAAANSLNRLVEDMLTFTRPSLPERVPIRSEDILDAAMELAGGALAGRPIEVAREYGALRPVSLDPELMQRAFLNVILNAAQVMPEGGRLLLQTAIETPPPGPKSGAEGGEEGPSALVVRIADTGPGVPEEIRERIFNPFFTRKSGGTGLGLAIVHKILQDHGGSVRVEANLPRGAAFVFVLPAGPVPTRK
ncbi:MAG: ATP-binding protein [Planctomycetota bacterium]